MKFKIRQIKKWKTDDGLTKMTVHWIDENGAFNCSSFTGTAEQVTTQLEQLVLNEGKTIPW